MAKARNNAMQTAAFTRRVVCRALTVLGGVAAGTALAWWLSSTSASAETELPVEVPAVVQDVAAPVVEPVRNTVDAVADRLQDPPAPSKDALGDLGQKVTGAAERFHAPAELPSCDTSVCLDNERHMYLVDGFGRSDLPGVPALAPATATDVPASAVDALASNTAKDRAFVGGMSRRGSPASVPALPTEPGLPNWPAPLPSAPGGVPTTTGHGSAGNAGDSHLFAALPWQDRAADELVAGGIAAATDAATSGRVGAQPGVAPD
ncbi:hypothetical protein [Actinophytocola sp.]|uniref:hypothetical protein n=1 Tax=Actinophytocola sp. TaxID=1872138 RepID=UPI00389AAE23